MSPFDERPANPLPPAVRRAMHVARTFPLERAGDRRSATRPGGYPHHLHHSSALEIAARCTDRPVTRVARPTAAALTLGRDTEVTAAMAGRPNPHPAQSRPGDRGRPLWSRKEDAMRSCILDAARTALGQRPPDSVTLDQIAAIAGVKLHHVRSYFTSVAAIEHALATPALDG